MLSREEGKTLPEGTGEVMRAARIFKYFAGEALRRHGQTLESTRPGIDVETYREAVGVFGLITPWNFPIAIPAWKAAPGAGLRQHRGAEAGQPRPRRSRTRSAQILHRSGRAAGRVQPRDRRRRRRPRDRRPSGRRRHLLHRLAERSARASPKARSSARRACSSRWAARTRWSCSTTPISSAP